MATSVTHHQQPNVRFFVACPRSGSSLLMRILAESPACAITSRFIVQDRAKDREKIDPDYSVIKGSPHPQVFIDAANRGKTFLVCKEDLGTGSREGEYLHTLFLKAAAYSTVRPIFLVRDPVRVFDSWKNVGCVDIDDMIVSYLNMFRTMNAVPSQAISCLLYEKLVNDPRNEIQRICSQWGIPFAESMLNFQQPFGTSFFFSSDRERDNFCDKKSQGLFTMVEANNSVQPKVPYHKLLSQVEIDTIEQRLGRLYLQCWQGDVHRLRAILKEKSWFGFDLDDTLHEFRSASGRATTAVLQRISKKFGTSTEVLKDEYDLILKAKTSSAFSEGKTSFKYRQERFASLLAKFNLPEDGMNVYLDLYETTLTQSLRLKAGVTNLLKLLKEMGKKVVIITEGPQDAQERTIKSLGIGEYVDFLATTNHFQLTKTTGLYKMVLDHLRISPEDIVYTGDNEQRDVIPAMAEGILPIHLDENSPVALNISPLRINTLWKLQYILSDGS
ncbi:hypothetical protein HJFPF1_09445 [Paramyrothecium foliicola]|nr:hypothetical protein HJFPF1_09445 [Paramyrothecium foliicola]